MASFSSREISNPPGVSERFKDYREALDISLAEAAAKTNIAEKYLQAMEADQFNKLPGEVYAKSFLKVYAKFLGLNADDLLSAYQTEQKIYTKTKSDYKLQQKKPVERISRSRLIVTPKIVRSSLIGLLALACVVYLGIKMVRIMNPPLLQVTQPINGLVTNKSFVQVAGKVEAETTLEMNGQQILVDKNGNFSETVDLQPGVNAIELDATNRHGRQTKVERQIIFNQ